MRRLEAAALVLFALTAALYVGGAAAADPGVGIARSDLEVLRGWKERGRIEDVPGDPSHLPKPGYLIFLRAMLPREGKDAGEARRFLVVNAAAIVIGIGAAALSLARGRGPRAAVLFLAFAVLYLPARDAADYVGSEPLAIGLSLLFSSGLLGARPAGPARAALLGLACAGILLLRPNLGWILLVVGLIALAAAPGRRWSPPIGLLGGFLAGSLLLVAVGRMTGLPTSPFGINTSKAFLWGTADYYWPPDVGGWPVGKTAAESDRLQMEKTKGRWRDLLSRRDADAARSLAWRAGHAVLSCEELPARWSARAYLFADRLLREWWWLAAAALFAAAVIAAAARAGPFRFVPLLLLLACVAQGLVFGADPRLSLPLIPLVALSLAASPPARVGPGAIAAGLLAATLPLACAVAVPDTANSDFVVLRGPGRRLEQRVPASRFPAAQTATLHLRIVKPAGAGLGLSISGNGEALFRRAPEDASPTPAFLSIALAGSSLERARRDGLRLEARTFGDPRAAAAFFYFPAVPPILRPAAAIDGARELPSGYGGDTRGSVPAWVHAGTD